MALIFLIVRIDYFMSMGTSEWEPVQSLSAWSLVLLLGLKGEGKWLIYLSMY